MSTDPRARETGEAGEAGGGIGVIVAGESSRAAPGTLPEAPPLGTIAGSDPGASSQGRAQRARERGAEAVRSHPLASLLLAAGAGAAATRLLLGLARR